MYQGKLDIVKRDMDMIDVNMLGVSNMKWTGMGHFKSDNHEVYYCGQDAQRRNGVAFICTDELRRCVMGFNPVCDRIATIRLLCKQRAVAEIPVCAVCDRRLECQSGTGRDKRHNRKIRTGGTE